MSFVLNNSIIHLMNIKNISAPTKFFCRNCCLFLMEYPEGIGCLLTNLRPDVVINYKLFGKIPSLRIGRKMSECKALSNENKVTS